MATDVPERAARFAREMAEMRADDPARGRQGLWLRVGLVVMVAGVVVAIVAAFRAADAMDPYRQGDAIALGAVGVSLTILGAAVYLRYALTSVLRFWHARLSFDLQEHADRREASR